MTIKATVKPRDDNRFDIYLAADNGELLLSSDQGYENVEDAERVLRRLFCPVQLTGQPQAVVMEVEYRTGKTKTEQLR